MILIAEYDNNGICGLLKYETKEQAVSAIIHKIRHGGNTTELTIYDAKQLKFDLTEV